MGPKRLPPHLVSKGEEKKACSECGQEFRLDVKSSLSRAFAEHVRTVHAPKPAKKPNHQ